MGKFLQKFFENQRLFQWLFVKRTKISDKNLNIWNFSDFLKKLKIFVNKNEKYKNVPPINDFFSDISVTFWKIPAKMKMATTSLIIRHGAYYFKSIIYDCKGASINYIDRHGGKRDGLAKCQRRREGRGENHWNHP